MRIDPRLLAAVHLMVLICVFAVPASAQGHCTTQVVTVTRFCSCGTPKQVRACQTCLGGGECLGCDPFGGIPILCRCPKNPSEQFEQAGQSFSCNPNIRVKGAEILGDRLTLPSAVNDRQVVTKQSRR